VLKYLFILSQPIPSFLLELCKPLYTDFHYALLLLDISKVDCSIVTSRWKESSSNHVIMSLTLIQGVGRSELVMSQ
jgi:hypothetical protein